MILGSLPKPDALRYRCHTILSLQRILAGLHAKAADHMPPQAQLQLLAVLQVAALAAVLALHSCVSARTLCLSICRFLAGSVLVLLYLWVSYQQTPVVLGIPTLVLHPPCILTIATRGLQDMNHCPVCCHCHCITGVYSSTTAA